jgi:hypothetical protein
VLAILRKRCWLLLSLLAVVIGGLPAAHAQELAKRLILKDGSYQLATKWEVKGDRVHYYSAERDEWEDVPNSMVDWPATEKYEKERAAGVPPPDAIQLDQEVEAERQADEAKNPQVAPGLRLEDPNTVYLLDTFQNQPQLVEVPQSGGDIERNTKKNILRAAINPVAGSKQTIEIPGEHAKAQAHVTVPSLYVNASEEPQPDATAQISRQPQAPQTPLPRDRFRIVHMQEKHGKRIVGDIKISLLGKASQEQTLVPSTATQLTGGWVMVTPDKPLPKGEYALVELLGKDGTNVYVWDFGVNPSAPANINPEQAGQPTAPAPDRPQLQKP